MPKVVDHQQRRSEIAQALWRVIARDGMAAASARTVAAESGWSLGAVRHYFPSQQALLHFAAEELMVAAASRIGQILRTRRRGIPRCVDLLEQLLPLDEQRTGEVRAFLALLVHAQADPVLCELPSQAWEGERRIARIVVADLAGLTLDTTTPLPARLESEAASIHGLVDGLTLQMTLAPLRVPPDEARRELTTLCRRVASRVR